MLYVKPFRQRTGYCGPAALKMVLGFFGVKKSETALAKMTNCKRSEGIEAEEIVKAVKKMGFKGFYKDFSTFGDLKKYVLKKKIPVIVEWFSDDDGHYSVAVDIDKENIYLQDPQIGYLRAVKLKTFKTIWFSFPGDFIESKDDMTIRRMIVIYR